MPGNLQFNCKIFATLINALILRILLKSRSIKNSDTVSPFNYFYTHCLSLDSDAFVSG